MPKKLPVKTAPAAAAKPPAATEFVPGPKLRKQLGISAVTLWRWRHDEALGFPPAKSIKGRLYFPLGPVTDWLARQQQAA
jgi:predicted DNA-binding transcriptional regulator AlpA